MKEALVKKLSGMMNDEQKKELIQMFYEKNKDKPDIENLLISMKDALDYKKDDVPIR